jgi:hypothetical protein
MIASEVIDNILSDLDDIRVALFELQRAQDEDSDAANEGHLQMAFAYLDNLEGAVGDIVP